MSFLERCTMSPSWPTWYSCENSDNFTVARIFLTFPPHRLILDWSPIKLPMGTATSTSLSSLLSAMTGWWFLPICFRPKVCDAAMSSTLQEHRGVRGAVFRGLRVWCLCCIVLQIAKSCKSWVQNRESSKTGSNSCGWCALVWVQMGTHFWHIN